MQLKTTRQQKGFIVLLKKLSPSFYRLRGKQKVLKKKNKHKNSFSFNFSSYILHKTLDKLNTRQNKKSYQVT